MSEILTKETGDGDLQVRSGALETVQMDGSGNLIYPVGLGSYIGCSAAFTPAATPTDLSAIIGKAAAVVKVYRTWITGIQTTAGNNWLYLVRRSAVNTGGTPALMTPIMQLDSSDSAPTATPFTYSANPSALGSAAGTIPLRVNSPAAATAGLGSGLVGLMFDFVAAFGKPLTLRGTSEGCYWNFNGVALPAGLSISIGYQWAEVPV